MKATDFFKNLEDNRVQCQLCPHSCRIAPGERGVCQVRENREGAIYSRNYGRISALNMDPIEKKPLYHFYPGKNILSVGTFGCNLHCQFCQNWQLAKGERQGDYASPEELVATVAARWSSETNIGIAFTYAEPLVWYEYVLDTAKVAQQEGLKVVLVTNGFVETEPLKKLLPYVDALNIDVKAFNDQFYQKMCKGSLNRVLENVKLATGQCHVEITTLVINGLNDSDAEIDSLTNWISQIDKNIPLHLSRYFPNYQLELPPTPLATMKRAKSDAQKLLPFVYLGNAWELGENNTVCPECEQIVIRRDVHQVIIVGLEKNRCSKCGYYFETLHIN